MYVVDCSSLLCFTHVVGEITNKLLGQLFMSHARTGCSKCACMTMHHVHVIPDDNGPRRLVVAVRNIALCSGFSSNNHAWRLGKNECDWAWKKWDNGVLMVTNFVVDFDLGCGDEAIPLFSLVTGNEPFEVVPSGNSRAIPAFSTEYLCLLTCSPFYPG